MTRSDRAVSRLRESLDAISGFEGGGGNALSPDFRKWQDRTTDALADLLGKESDEAKKFRSLGFWNLRMNMGRGVHWNAGDQDRFLTDLDRARTLLTDVLEDARSRPEDNSSADFWSLLHPSIVTVARARFDANQFADAVEAALKEVNSIVKARMRRAGRGEMDGAQLMNAAFSPNAPVIVLDDLGTESGKQAQQGYMQIFAGAMTGIRNPKAHENISITPERAIHHLFLASLLLSKLDEASGLPS